MNFNENRLKDVLPADWIQKTQQFNFEIRSKIKKQQKKVPPSKCNQQAEVSQAG